LTFQNTEDYRREPTPDYEQQAVQKGQSQVFKFAYAHPDDYIENYLNKRCIHEQQAMRIPRIPTPVHVLPNSKLTIKQ
jgi:hypothetical protein